MNSAGAITRPSARSHRTNASRPQIPDRRQLHDRLIEDREVVALDRATQLGLEGEALHRGRVHVRIEDLVAASTRRLCAIHGDVGVAKQSIDGAGLRAPTTIPMLAAPRSSVR